MMYDPTDPSTFPLEREAITAANPALDAFDTTSQGCPRALADIRRYVRAELGASSELFWGRTAIVNGVRFWLWGLVHDGRTYYVDVSEKDGVPLLSMGLGEGLTPEQYLALRYARAWRDPNDAHRTRPIRVQG